MRQPLWTAPASRPEVEKSLARELGIHLVTARLLVNRGIDTPETARTFLAPDLDLLHDPWKLPDMDRAARRIADAVRAREKIFIHGDYDVDGVTSTALYVRALEALGADLIYRVPHRRRDGYDIKEPAISWAHERGASLVITSDCGIQAHGPVAYANSLGMTVIVTDHHEPGETLPPAYAVVNPHRKDSSYPFPEIAGVGVAYKTMQAVVRLMKPSFERKYLERFLDLAACGTIADVMPLADENRVIASLGLRALAATKKAGLRALLDCIAAEGDRPLTSETVGFGIGPRINAVGRLDDAAVALDLMLTHDIGEAQRIVSVLNKLNLERRETQRRIVDEALQKLAERDLGDVRVLVLAAQGWNSGVVGIVAGKLVERFCRPAIVIGLSEDGLFGKGSARSIPAFNLFAGIQECRQWLTSCGGHEMAAGLSLPTDNLDAFERAINTYAAAVLTDEDLTPRIMHDGIVKPRFFSPDLVSEWAGLAPFGQANAEPQFVSKGLMVSECRRIGSDESHLKMTVVGNGSGPIDCVGWGMGDWADRLTPGVRVDALYSPQINDFNGRRSVQFLLKDMRTAPPAAPA